jgi:hypothetical protein
MANLMPMPKMEDSLPIERKNVSFMPIIYPFLPLGMSD